MLKVNSGADGYSGNWVRVCDTCKAAACTLHCHNDSAYLCSSCDEHIRAADSMALPHERVRVFTSCENAPAAAFSSKADAASLCVNPLPGHVPIPPVSSLVYANSSTYPEELPGAMVDTAEEEIHEDETDSWLLPEPEENNDNQTNGGFTYLEEPDKSFGIKDYNSCTEIQYQDQKNQQQLYNAYQGDSGSDGIVPVHSFEVKEQEGHWQLQHQQQHNFYFNKEYKASKAAFINTPSSSQSVPMPFSNAGIITTAISDNPSSYTRYPNETTDFFPKFSLLMPLQFTPLNREAKVLRYREKRKARRFEKKTRYASRKAYAEARPRVKGRFVRKTDMDFEVGEMFSIEDYGYGIVPSY